MSIQTATEAPEWTLGDRIYKTRRSTGLSQAEFAETIGISRRSLGKYENDQTVPNKAVLLSMALFAGVPVDWLRFGTTSDQGNPPTICNTMPQSARRRAA